MTAKDEGLWDTLGVVTREEIKHMKNRVELFRATHVISEDPDDFEVSPACASSWCRWVLTDSVAYAARQGPVRLSGGVERTRLALPVLEDTRGTVVGTQRLTAQQAQKVEENRQRALRQRRESPQKKSRPNAGGGWPMDEEDPFGFGALGQNGV